MGEGKDARVAGAAVTPYATGTRPRRRGSAARCPSGTRWRGPRTPAQWSILLWQKWRASLREVFQASKRFGFALSHGNHSHTPAGQILKAAERLRRKDYTSMPWRKNQATGTAVAPVE